MMTDIKKRGLDSLISQNSRSGDEINEGPERYTKIYVYYTC